MAGVDSTPRDAVDAIIIGDGIIGLSTALELARGGGRGHIVGVTRDGFASTAAAGLIAPSLGRLEPGVREFYFASVARWPSFSGRLRTIDEWVQLVPGLLDVSSTTASAEVPPNSVRLSADDVAAHEPGLVAPAGGLLHLRDFAIDNVRVVAALRLAISRRTGITVTPNDAATEVSFERGYVTVRTAGGASIHGRNVVLAAGAWSPQIRGLPRPLPVIPLKGQMLALEGSPLTRSVAGDDVYLVPRRGPDHPFETLVGATVEHEGFDTTVHPSAIERLRQAAVAMFPALADARVTRQWAGIRPATPDLRPIIGRDQDQPSLIYACGHSKNGILLAPETARVVSRLILDAPPELDLTAFRVDRFTA